MCGSQMRTFLVKTDWIYYNNCYQKYEFISVIRCILTPFNKRISTLFPNHHVLYCFIRWNSLTCSSSLRNKLLFKNSYYYYFRNPNLISTEEQQNENLRGRYEKIVWPPYEPVHQKYLSIGKIYLNIFCIAIIL